MLDLTSPPLGGAAGCLRKRAMLDMSSTEAVDDFLEYSSQP